MKKILVAVLFVFMTASFALVAAQHEYAPIEEKTINYKDWTFKNLADGKPFNLREFTQGKKLVMVVYFAPWCGNWHLEEPVAKALYDKYHKDGLEMIGVSEYGSVDEAKAIFGTGGAPFTLVEESESRDAKQTTTHFGYRKLAGDTRNWGSPWNIFLEPAKLNATGDVLTEKAYVISGELVEADVDQFIRLHLGLDTKTAGVPMPNNGTTTPCEPATKPALVVKKP